MKKQTVTVELKVTYNCTSIWTDDCTVGQIKKQAGVEATTRINKVLGCDPLVKNLVIGDVVVTSQL